jgi:hypothetical protein
MEEGNGVGKRVVGNGVGADVANSVGEDDGAPVGVVVAKHCISFDGSTTKPSKHTHTQPLSACAAMVDANSHPRVPSKHTSQVGMCVGDDVGKACVGDVEGL